MMCRGDVGKSVRETSHYSCFVFFLSMGLILSLFRNDDNHKSDPELLRSEASDLFARSKILAQRSQEAYRNGKKKEAHELSLEKKRLIELAEERNRQASNAVLHQMNRSRPDNELDLHGLYVDEAILAVRKRLSDDIDTDLIIITGRGNRSQGQVAKIKPAIIGFLSENGYNFIPNDPNDGCIKVVKLKKRVNKTCFIL
jgi:hypothetical protein